MQYSLKGHAEGHIVSRDTENRDNMKPLRMKTLRKPEKMDVGDIENRDRTTEKNEPRCVMCSSPQSCEKPGLLSVSQSQAITNA